MASVYVPYEGPIVTLNEARTRGLIRYFTGIPCKFGHLAERFVSVRGCCACRANPSRVASEERYKAANREKLKAKTARWREQDPERAKASSDRSRSANRSKINSSRRAAYAAKADKMRAEKRARYAADPLKYLAINAAWRTANPEKAAAVRRNRRARKRNSPGAHTAEDIKTLWKLQRGRCASGWCRADLKHGHHVDHIKSLSRGGSNDRTNLQLLCAPCNLSKHATDPIEWAQRNGLLL